MENDPNKSRASTPPDSIEPRRRPERAEVYKKKLTGIEQSVILAMLEIAGGNSDCLRMSIPRIAAYSKFDEKSVQRAIWGDHRKHPGQPRPKRENGRDKECPFCADCLINRRVLQPLAPAKWKDRRPARYRLNLEILDDSDAVRRYLDQKQFDFPAEEKRPTVASPSVPRSHPQRPTVASPSVPRSHDSKAFDSRALDPKERETHQPALSLSLDQEGEIENEWAWSQRRGR